MQKNSSNEMIHAFMQKCRGHRLKITPQRVAIYKKIVGLNIHPTADDIYQIIKKDFSNISFDTVNRTLSTFVEIGVIDMVEIFGGARRFDPDLSIHHHFYCIHCGDIIDFKDPNYDDLPLPETLHNDFHVISKRLILKGLCKTCVQHKQN